jgi:hypothetical protein
MQPAVLFDQPQKFGLDFTQLTRHVTLTLRLATPGGHNPEFLLQFQFLAIRDPPAAVFYYSRTRASEYPRQHLARHQWSHARGAPGCEARAIAAAGYRSRNVAAAAEQDRNGHPL